MLSIKFKSLTKFKLIWKKKLQSDINEKKITHNNNRNNKANTLKKAVNNF